MSLEETTGKSEDIYTQVANTLLTAPSPGPNNV